MSKIMTVDVLSSIKGAQESESVNKLFQVIKNANISNTNNFSDSSKSLSLNHLRDDIVINSSEREREIIIENFPKEKNGYLVVAKVIEE